VFRAGVNCHVFTVRSIPYVVMVGGEERLEEKIACITGPSCARKVHKQAFWSMSQHLTVPSRLVVSSWLLLFGKKQADVGPPESFRLVTYHHPVLLALPIAVREIRIPAGIFLEIPEIPQQSVLHLARCPLKVLPS